MGAVATFLDITERKRAEEALQKAKLYFIQNNGSEKLLPYYWANMILIGNADNIQFESQHNNNYLLWGGAGILLLA